MTDESLLVVLKWLGVADIVLLLCAVALGSLYLSIEYVLRITGVSRAVVAWRFDKWRASVRIVTKKSSALAGEKPDA